MSKTIKATLLLFLFLSFGVFADQPDWINKLPFSDDAFWGVGSGSTQEEAEFIAKKEILMQLSSHVQAAISIEEHGNSNREYIAEDFDSYFESIRLRGAELAEKYENGDQVWVLMKYCDNCGDMLMESALVRYKNKYDLSSESIMAQLNNGNINEIMKVEKRLKELNLDDYRSDDIFVIMEGKIMKILIINFLPYKTDLTESQKSGLSKLSSTLFEELNEINYERLVVVGHANPTGEDNEKEDLMTLSRNRAQTMSIFLKRSGVDVDSELWRAGDETIGNISTAEGKGLNRRVEIVIYFE